MDTKMLLHSDLAKARRKVLDKLELSDEILSENMLLLKNWFHQQKQLFEIPCNQVLENFLIVNRCNLENCKKRLEMYFMIRKEIPELFVNKNPKSGHMQKIANTVFTIPLPKLTPSLSRVTVMKLKDSDPENFHPLDYFAHTYNIVEIRLREDIVVSDTLIYDMMALQFGHLWKLGTGPLRKAAAVLEKVFSTRIEGIHFINLPASMHMIVSLVKTMLREKMRKRIHVHENLESLCELIPREVLPLNYGGNDLDLEQLHALWIKKMQEYHGIFDNLEMLCSENTEQSGHLENSCNSIMSD